MFKITQTLFGVKYQKVENASIWQEDVTMYEVLDNGKIIGRFYLDLYPRDNKYGHAACFGIQNGMASDKGYQIPTVALEVGPMETPEYSRMVSAGSEGLVVVVVVEAKLQYWVSNLILLHHSQL